MKRIQIVSRREKQIIYLRHEHGFDQGCNAGNGFAFEEDRSRVEAGRDRFF